MRRSLALTLLIAHAAVANADRASLREEARAILRTHCGRCHDGAQATAKPAALAVFDLTSAAWADGLSDARLGKVIGRMEGSSAPAADRDKIKAFVDAERAARGLQKISAHQGATGQANIRSADATAAASPSSRPALDRIDAATPPR